MGDFSLRVKYFANAFYKKRSGAFIILPSLRMIHAPHNDLYDDASKQEINRFSIFIIV
ncbi:MAG TPA: hypothetical protein VIJ92_03930 [Ginsengibacter sp.]